MRSGVSWPRTQPVEKPIDDAKTDRRDHRAGKPITNAVDKAASRERRDESELPSRGHVRKAQHHDLVAEVGVEPLRGLIRQAKSEWYDHPLAEPVRHGDAITQPNRPAGAPCPRAPFDVDRVDEEVLVEAAHLIDSCN